MRILLLHNYYGSQVPSGENQVFEIEAKLLRDRGHEVQEFTRESDEIRATGIRGVLRGGLATPWNPWMLRDVRRRISAFRPDIVHAHNTFPLLSPAVFYAAAGVAPTVLTLHNYRLYCASAVLSRGGRVCTECIDQASVVPALRHGCYRDSRLATIPLAASVALHRGLGTWQRRVNAFVVLTEFQRATMVRAGIPAERIWVKPNFYPGAPVAPAWDTRADRVVFAGRLADEKGVDTLVRAWLHWGPSAPPLRLIGDGPLRASLETLARTMPAVRIEFAGALSQAETVNEIAAARLLVVPSQWFEGFPMVIREAFAHGTPVAASRIGALPTIVEDGVSGVLFEPSNQSALVAAVRAAWADRGLLQVLARGARAAFDAHYNEDRNYAQLMAIYQHAQESMTPTAGLSHAG